MKHRGIDYEVEEVSPSRWRWKIHQITGAGLISDQEYSNIAAANIECVNRINAELGAANDA